MHSLARLLLAFSLTALLAQNTNSQQRNTPVSGSDARPSTAYAAAGRLRFTAPPETAALRLEVCGEGGRLLAEVPARGSVHEWAGERGRGAAPRRGLPAGSDGDRCGRVTDQTPEPTLCRVGGSGPARGVGVAGRVVGPDGEERQLPPLTIVGGESGRDVASAGVMERLLVRGRGARPRRHAL